MSDERESLRTRARNAWLMLRHGSQWWYWTPEWQAGEREVEDDLAAGRVESFDNMADLIAAMEIDPADQHPRDCVYPYGVCTCCEHDHPANQTHTMCEACVVQGEVGTSSVMKDAHALFASPTRVLLPRCAEGHHDRCIRGFWNALGGKTLCSCECHEGETEELRPKSKDFCDAAEAVMDELAQDLRPKNAEGPFR